MRLSIVSTLYQSAASIEEFCERASAAAHNLTPDYEIILVNDGSTDASLELALTVFQHNKHIKILDLSRNFGHHKAMMTGLAAASGDLVFLIDSDLEEEPEWLALLNETLLREGADVAYGVQRHRKGGWFERLSGAVFFGLFNRISDTPIPSNVLTARLMTRRYVRNLVRHRERTIIISGLWQLTGYKQVAVELKKHSTKTSTYSFFARIGVLVEAVTSFSAAPLTAVFYLGSVISLTSFLAIAYLVIRRLFFNVFFDGWPSLIVSVWFLGGLTIFSVGLIGIYLSRIFVESKHRPYTIIRDVYEHRD